MTGITVQSFAAVLVVLALVGGLAWLLRRGAFASLRRGPRPIAVETAVPLGERRSLVIVAVEGRRILLGLPAHHRIQVEADDRARRTHLPSRDDRVEPGSAAEIEHGLAGPQPAPLVRIAYPGEGPDRARRRTLEPLGGVTEQLRGLPAVMEVEGTVWLVGDLLIHPQNLVLQHCFQ